MIHLAVAAAQYSELFFSLPWPCIFVRDCILVTVGACWEGSRSVTAVLSLLPSSRRPKKYSPSRELHMRARVLCMRCVVLLLLRDHESFSHLGTTVCCAPCCAHPLYSLNSPVRTHSASLASAPLARALQRLRLTIALLRCHPRSMLPSHHSALDPHPSARGLRLRGPRRESYVSL